MWVPGSLLPLQKMQTIIARDNVTDKISSKCGHVKGANEIIMIIINR